MAGKKLSEYIQEWSNSPWSEEEIFAHIKSNVDPQEEIVPHINRYFKELATIKNILHKNGYEYG